MTIKTLGRFVFPALLVFASLGFVFFDCQPGSHSVAEAQIQPEQTEDITVVPVQISRDSYGIALVDKTAQTLCIYEFDSRGSPNNRLRLFAARNFQYDKLLQQFNTADPKPSQVKAMLEDYGVKEKREQQKDK